MTTTVNVLTLVSTVCRWTNPIMRKGFREKLRPSDVYQAPSEDAADVLAERLEKCVFYPHFSWGVTIRDAGLTYLVSLMHSPFSAQRGNKTQRFWSEHIYIMKLSKQNSQPWSLLFSRETNITPLSLCLCGVFDKRKEELNVGKPLKCHTAYSGKVPPMPCLT